MFPALNEVKGVSPGAILRRALKRIKLKSVDLAREINEYPQTINAILNERRKVNPKLSYRLGNYFNIDQDYFLKLQASYEVEAYRKSEIKRNAAFKEKFREALFWDCDFQMLDPDKHRRYIVQRVLERGNAHEIENLLAVYSSDQIRDDLPFLMESNHPNFDKNVQEYIIRLSNISAQ